MKYRKKPALTEATQWFKNGDHPQDRSVPIDSPGGKSTKLTEGQVVKFFRSLNIPGGRFCSECGQVMQKHGTLIGLGEQEEIVHPGDYIVTHPKGHYYVVRTEVFEAMFEPYDPAATITPVSSESLMKTAAT